MAGRRHVAAAGGRFYQRRRLRGGQLAAGGAAGAAGGGTAAGGRGGGTRRQPEHAAAAGGTAAGRSGGPGGAAAERSGRPAGRDRCLPSGRDRWPQPRHRPRSGVPGRERRRSRAPEVGIGPVVTEGLSARLQEVARHLGLSARGREGRLSSATVPEGISGQVSGPGRRRRQRFCKGASRTWSSPATWWGTWRTASLGPRSGNPSRTMADGAPVRRPPEQSG